jgi:hypothetical protein
VAIQSLLYYSKGKTRTLGGTVNKLRNKLSDTSWKLMLGSQKQAGIKQL